MKKIILELPEELIADLGYVKMYLEALKERLHYPNSPIGHPETSTYIENSLELMAKVSKGLDFAIKKRIDKL